MASEIDIAEIDMASAEVLQVPTAIKKFIRITPGADLKLDTSVVAKADTAMQIFADDGPKWMAQEIENLRILRQRVSDDGQNAANTRLFYLALHNMKGQALNLGFPLVGQIAGSLCDTFEAVAHDKISPQIIDYHVGAIAALVKENVTGATNETAQKLLKKLRDVTKTYLTDMQAKTAGATA